MAGWGVFSQHDDEESPILRKVELPYVDNAVCNVAYNNGITPSMTCYGETGKGFCLGGWQIAKIHVLLIIET